MQNKLFLHKQNLLLNSSFLSTFLLVTFLLPGLSACNKNDSTSKPAEISGTKATQISAVKVDTQNLALFEESIGTLEGVIDPTVAAEIAARVLKVLVHPGQTVKKGETVALLDRKSVV